MVCKNRSDMRTDIRYDEKDAINADVMSKAIDIVVLAPKASDTAWASNDS